MKISRFIYGILIIGILLGGLALTNLAGIWEVNRRTNGITFGNPPNSADQNIEINKK